VSFQFSSGASPFLLILLRIPDSLDLHAAALAEPLSVVLQAFKRANLQPGSKVLVLGAGAVGLLTCSLARASGCPTVIAVDIEQGKLDFAQQMGWTTGTHLLPRGPRASGAEALEVAKTNWEGLKSSQVFTGVLGLEDGFDAVFECTGVESCMQMAVMVSPCYTMASAMAFSYEENWVRANDTGCCTWI
jgi:L-iditol 2-dehydrogenase